MNQTVEDVKTTTWGSILNALPFDGGPSSTRWVYLSAFLTVAFCLIVLTISLSWVYIRSHEHIVNIVMAGLIGTTITTVVGFATATQKKKLGQGADSDSGDTAAASASTASVPSGVTVNVTQTPPAV